MAVDVVLTVEARKDLRQLKNAVIAARIDRLVERLKNWPNVSGVKALRGKLAGKFRVRTGDYRLQFRVESKPHEADNAVDDVDEERAPKQRVVVEKIGHRDGFYDE